MKNILISSILFIMLCSCAGQYEEARKKADVESKIILKEWYQCVLRNVDYLSEKYDDPYKIAEMSASACRMYRSQIYNTFTPAFKERHYPDMIAQDAEMVAKDIAVQAAIKADMKKRSNP